MKATRVKKFEKYWMIDSDLMPVHFIDDRRRCSNTDYDNGNYFNTKEEAEAMADKIRKVLNGANVIEIPSAEEVKKAAVLNDSGYFDDCQISGFIDGVEWLKSKIVG